MVSVKKSGLVCAALFATACAPTENNYTLFGMSTPYYLQVPETSDELRTARSGDVISTHTLNVAAAAILDQTVVETQPVAFEVAHTIEAGTMLFGVGRPNQRRLFFCTNTTTSSYQGTFSEQTGQSCLSDLDLDGQFDRVYQAAENTRWSPYSRGMLSSGFDLETPAPYTIVQTNDFEPVTIEVHFESISLGGHFFKPYVTTSDGGRAPVFGAFGPESRIDFGAEFPQTFRVLDMDIVVHSLDQGTGEIVYSTRTDMTSQVIINMD